MLGRVVANEVPYGIFILSAATLNTAEGFSDENTKNMRNARIVRIGGNCGASSAVCISGNLERGEMRMGESV